MLDRFVRDLHATLITLLAPASPAAAMLATTKQLLGTATLTHSSVADSTIRPTLPATRYLPSALNTASLSPGLTALVDSLRALSPELSWVRRTAMAGAGPEFADGHANAVLVGEGGIAVHSRLTIGVTVMAPGVLYADHSHPPSEVYLVLSPGQWRQDNGAWHEPGIGGTVYNPPGIVHAMRSADAPLVAIWTLLADTA